MDSSSRTSGDLLNALHTLTASMLELAKKGEMDELEGLELQRQKVVVMYQHSLSDHGFVDDEYPDKLRQLVALDAELMTLCQAVKEQIALHLQEMSAGKKMQQAYKNHSG